MLFTGCRLFGSGRRGSNGGCGSAVGTPGFNSWNDDGVCACVLGLSGEDDTVYKVAVSAPLEEVGRQACLLHPHHENNKVYIYHPPAVLIIPFDSVLQYYNITTMKNSYNLIAAAALAQYASLVSGHAFFQQAWKGTTDYGSTCIRMPVCLPPYPLISDTY